MGCRTVVACPLCSSTDTVFNAAEMDNAQKKVSIGWAQIWHCLSCKHFFGAPDESTKTPVLWCLKCEGPTVHEFKCVTVRKEPNGDTAAAAPRVQVYACGCGEERAFGLA